MNKFPSPAQKAMLKSYGRAVLASAITLTLAVSANLAPQYAVLIGAFTAPLVKWADKAEKEFGRKR
jgi:hypothetical protein